MGDVLRVNGRLSIPLREIRVEAARSGGPGGQNVNKTSSKVVLRFSVRDSEALGDARRARLLRALAHRLSRRGELVLHASRHRERRRNLEDALERLAELLRSGLATPKRRIATRPTAGSRERRLEAKRQKGERKRLRRPPEE